MLIIAIVGVLFFCSGLLVLRSKFT